MIENILIFAAGATFGHYCPKAFAFVVDKAEEGYRVLERLFTR